MSYGDKLDNRESNRSTFASSAIPKLMIHIEEISIL